jgi:hypothetical protein
MGPINPSEFASLAREVARMAPELFAPNEKLLSQAITMATKRGKMISRHSVRMFHPAKTRGILGATLEDGWLVVANELIQVDKYSLSVCKFSEVKTLTITLAGGSSAAGYSENLQDTDFENWLQLDSTWVWLNKISSPSQVIHLFGRLCRNASVEAQNVSDAI